MSNFKESWKGAQGGNQATSLAAKLGFQDPDRKDPQHDEIVLWMDGKLRDEEFRLRFLFQIGRLEVNPEWVAAQRREAAAWVAESQAVMKDLLGHEDDSDPMGSLSDRAVRMHNAYADLNNWTPDQMPLPETPIPSLDELVWEQAVGDPRWIAGFIDLYTVIGKPNLYVNHHLGEFDPEAIYRRDTPIALPTFRAYYQPSRLAFEVKTTLPSLGDLIRQIRFYQEKWSGQTPTFYVVSSDTRYIATLRVQGIGFVEYPSGEITHPEK